MSKLEKLKDLLESSNNIYLASISNFIPVNIKKLKESLRLEAKAKQNGSKQLPRSGSEDFDDVESEIINVIESERARCLNEFNDQLTTYNQRLANLSIEARLTQVTLAAREAISDFKAQTLLGKDELTISLVDLKNHADALNRFKAENKLNRPAYYPPSKTFHYGIVAVLFLIEAFLNGSFLSIGNDLGLLGGFIEAIIIAFLNIVLALVVGEKIIPYIWHNGIIQKLIGAGFTSVFLVVNFFFNLSVAHYRDALANEMSTQAVKIALSSFLATPFDIADFKSWMMVGVGCSFAFFALIDGFKMDDPYPNYGNIDRRRNSAYEVYANNKFQLFDELKDTRDVVSSALAKLKEQLVKQRQEHDSIIANRQNLLVNLETHQNYLESSGRELITFYRAKNQEARNTPAPQYFDRTWHLERKVSPTLPARALTDEHLNDVMFEANSAIQSAIVEVMAAYDQAITEIDQISAIINSKAADHHVSA